LDCIKASFHQQIQLRLFIIFIMATIRIENVSYEACTVLQERAAAAGQSLQEYMLDWLEKVASRPSVDEVLDRISHRSGGHISVDDVVRQLREERDSR
jgi:antitoxin FitA